MFKIKVKFKGILYLENTVYYILIIPIVFFLLFSTGVHIWITSLAFWKNTDALAPPHTISARILRIETQTSVYF